MTYSYASWHRGKNSSEMSVGMILVLMIVSHRVAADVSVVHP